MPFDWRASQRTLEKGGMGIAGSILQEGARQKEEKRLIEREKRQYDLHIEELDESFKRNKDLADYKAKINAEYITFENNADMKSLYDKASLPTANAETKGFVAGLEAIKFKQQSLISLGKEDYEFKKRLINAGYEGISLWVDNRELANARLIKQLETRDREYKTQLEIRRAREKELSLARKLEAENKRLIIEQRKKKGKEGVVEKLEEAVDARDKATGQLVELLSSKGWLQYDKATKKWLARQFSKRESIFNDEGEITKEARVVLIKKHPELRPFFNEVEKLAERVRVLRGTPKEQIEVGGAGTTKAPSGVEKDERGLIVGKVYEDEAGKKARYLGSGQWEILD